MNKNRVMIFEWIKMLCVAFVVSIVIEIFLMSITIVSGESMMSTIHDQDRLLVNKYVYRFREPKRGEIIIFNPPIEERQDELFIKRVIATEGDIFFIDKTHIIVNGEELSETYIEDQAYYPRSYNLLYGKVPEGHVFVLGDNRNNSNDSRSFGFLPVEQIKGKAVTKIWPFEEVTTFAVHYPKNGDGKATLQNTMAEGHTPQ